MGHWPANQQTDAHNNMDINEFLKNVQPGKKVSRLKKYEQEISELKSKGYTDDQIRQWLAQNDLVVSREAVRRFAKKISQTATPQLSDNKAVEVTNKANESNAEKIQRRLAEQQEQARSTVFKHDKSGKQTE